MPKFSLANSFLIFLILIFSSSLLSFEGKNNYPEDWWRYVSEDDAYPWEIVPQDAGPGEVILSKRTELGVFSNLGYSPFVLDGVQYSSVEGLWQMMKYPDGSSDPRSLFEGWPYTRIEVQQLYGMESKRAGKFANKIMKEHNINWISYGAYRFNYKDMEEGSKFHYELIKRAIWAKVIQNKKVKKLLLKTNGLKLRPDHRIRSSSPESYFYHKILMDIRSILNQ